LRRWSRRVNDHIDLHVHGYQEEGTITTPFDMTVPNDLNRFRRVRATIDRLPQTGDKVPLVMENLAPRATGDHGSLSMAFAPQRDV